MTTTPPVYTAHDVPDLINALPTMLGFHVEESLVAVATHGPRRRFGFRLRIDVPEPQHVDHVGAVVAGHLRHQHAEGAILIAVTERQEAARDLLDAVCGGLGPVELVVRVRADGRRYWTDEPGAPEEGTPYETSPHHLSIVEAVAAGQQILPGRGALVERFAAVTGARREWLRHATAAILDEVVPLAARTPPDELPDVGMAVVGPILDRGLAGGRLSDADALRVAAWCSSIGVRDEVWALMTRDNAESMLRVLVEVCRTVVPPFEPAVLSLTSFAAWLTGDGAQALIAAERALAADPDYSMAHLMVDVLQGGLSPATWEGFTAGGSPSP